MKVLISCGGTGGHIYPAIAIAKELKKKNIDLFFVGSDRLEKELIPREGFRLLSLVASRINPFKIFRGVMQGVKIILKEKPDIVLCTGGYVTLPTAVAALLLRKPIFIQEQNILPGKINKLLSHCAKKVFIPFERANKYFNPKKTILTGNPIRPEISTTKYDPDAKKVLIFGGSLSARSINQAVYEMLKELKPDFEIIHLDGKNYSHDMAKLYQEAALVVCRAGAMTVAELAAVGLPAILIPYPYASNDHQLINAQFLVEKGAAQVLLNKDLSAKKLYESIKQLLVDRAKRINISGKIKGLSLADPVGKIINTMING